MISRDITVAGGRCFAPTRLFDDAASEDTQRIDRMNSADDFIHGVGTRILAAVN